MSFKIRTQEKRPNFVLPLGDAITDESGKPVTLEFREPQVSDFFELTQDAEDLTATEPFWPKGLAGSVLQLGKCHVAPAMEQRPFRFYQEVANANRDLFMHILAEFKAAFPEAKFGTTEESVANSKND